jgi:pyrophosphatase PpaX
MQGYLAVLFDLDGTLIHSKGVIGSCINNTLVHFGLPPFEKNELHDLVGVPLAEALAKRTGDTKPLIDYFRKLYISNYKEGTWIYDGMESVLSNLKDRDKKIGIVTLKATFVAKEVLKGLELMNYVDAVEGDDDISDLKPSPDQINRICRQLDVSPGKTVMVGDTSMDILAGKNAGCGTIGVLWGAMTMDTLVEAGADYLARDTEELLEILNRF